MQTSALDRLDLLHLIKYAAFAHSCSLVILSTMAVSNYVLLSSKMWGQKSKMYDFLWK